MKMLFILNVANRVNNFCMSSLVAAKELGIEYHIAGNWNYLNDAERKADETKYAITIHQIDFVRSPLNLKNYKAYEQLRELAVKEKFDVVHCNTPIGGVLGRLIFRRMLNTKIIYQAHGLHFYKGAPKLNWLLFYPVEKWLAHYTDVVITINKEDYELVKRKFKLRNDGKIYYVPGVGIDCSGYNLNFQNKNVKRKEFGIPNDAFVVVSVGELNKNKNNGVVISAIEKLKQKNIHYLLCGVGEREFALKKQAQDADLQDNIHFLGYRTDIKEIYALADCFVMPSFREGLSRSIMEAMASGLPCIVSKIRGNMDLIVDGYGGFLCPVKDVDAYAEKLNTLMNDSQMRSVMGNNNIHTIRNFSIETVVEGIKKIYVTQFDEI